MLLRVNRRLQGLQIGLHRFISHGVRDGVRESLQLDTLSEVRLSPSE